MKNNQKLSDLFVPYRFALLAKDEGFDGECFGYFSSHFDETEPPISFEMKHTKEQNWHSRQICSAPVYQQLVDWLELNYGFFFERIFNEDGSDHKYILWLSHNMAYSELKTLDEAISEAFDKIKNIQK